MMIQITQKKIKEIKPYFRNPRKITDKAIDRVAESIRRYGFRQPIAIDTNGEIVAGHVRYEAAKKLKLKEVPVVILDKLSAEQVKAYRLVDNKSRELSEWNFDKLEYELARIAESDSDVDMSEFGFDVDIDAVIEKENAQKDRKLAENEELNLDDFSEESFKYCCPKCGMRFNK